MQNKKGFTLIELMIVVAIVAILAMVAVPMYSRYIERSRDTAAQNLLQQLAIAQVASQTEGISGGSAANYIELTTFDAAAVNQLIRFGFRPDPNVGMASYLANGEPGFVAIAAHRANNSNVFVYDNIRASGVAPFDPAITYQTTTAVTGGLIIFYMDSASGTAQVDTTRNTGTVTFSMTSGKVTGSTD